MSIIPHSLYDVDIYRENFEERVTFKKKNSYNIKKREEFEFEFELMLTDDNVILFHLFEFLTTLLDFQLILCYILLLDCVVGI